MIRLKVALDCDIPGRLAGVLGSMYGHNGFEFYLVSKLVPPGSPDEFWADAFKRFGGHLMISGDTRIAYTPHKARSFIDNKFISFFMQPPWHHMPANLKAAHIIHSWPIIESKIRNGMRGTCWRVPCQVKKVGGKHIDLRLMPTELLALEIPSHVIENASPKRNSN